MHPFFFKAFFILKKRLDLLYKLAHKHTHTHELCVSDLPLGAELLSFGMKHRQATQLCCF